MMHPFWDMALLQTDSLPIKPLEFLTEDPDDLVGRDVAVIGYPAFDSRNDARLQLRIFRSVFNIKRLQPGRLRARRTINSFGNLVSAVTHDSSTLGGNSGSAVIDVQTGNVVALHFAGIYLDANFAVPAFELARDSRIHEAGVNFGDARPSANLPWDPHWQIADPESSERSVQATAPEDTRDPGSLGIGETATWSIPLNVTVSLGRQAMRLPSVAATGAVERMVEPYHDRNYALKAGYDQNFLGIVLPMPEPRDKDKVYRLEDGNHVIPYEHFSLIMHKDRRLAICTAANVDGRIGSQRPDLRKRYSRDAISDLSQKDREKWFLDPRIPKDYQLSDRFFNKDRGAFDKGHLVRRKAVAWGATYEEVRRANGDTYHVTNCAPQVSGFNRSNLAGLWGVLENIVSEQSRTTDQKYCVSAGPTLSSTDPPFSGFDDCGPVSVLIPRRFWKIVVAKADDRLRSFAFLLDQDLNSVDFEFLPDSVWRGRMIWIADVENEVKILSFPSQIHDSDQAESPAGESVRLMARLERFIG